MTNQELITDRFRQAGELIQAGYNWRVRASTGVGPGKSCAIQDPARTHVNISGARMIAEARQGYGLFGINGFDPINHVIVYAIVDVEESLGYRHGQWEAEERTTEEALMFLSLVQARALELVAQAVTS